jgi:arsenate reductase (thioredoxin)
MKFLFICTHNRCRSILSEAITNQLSGGRIAAISAGSQPVDGVHPLSIKYLQAKGYSIEGLKSTSWHEIQQEQPDVVITVCDSAAQEVCPLWLGDAIKVHWGLPDPSRLAGSETEIQQMFFAVMDTIEKRIAMVMELDLELLERTELEIELNAIPLE